MFIHEVMKLCPEIWNIGIGCGERCGLPMSSQDVAFPDIMPSCDLTYARVLLTVLAVVLAQSNFEAAR